MKGKIVLAVGCVVVLLSILLLVFGGPGTPEAAAPGKRVAAEVEEGKVLGKRANGPDRLAEPGSVSQNPLGEREPARPDSGEIAGRVVDLEGRPVVGCEVIASSWHGNPPDFISDSPDFRERGWYRVDEPYAVTDAKGEFQIRNLPWGIYDVGFRARGFVAQTHPRPLTIADIGPMSRIEQTLEPAGVIFGRVIEDLTGKPIEGATISAAITSERMMLHRESAGGRRLHLNVVTFSDAGGRFKLDVLYPNEIYDLAAEDSDHPAVKMVSVAVDTGEPVEFVLSSGGIIEGMVVSAVPGVGADGATVIASIEGAKPQSVTSSASGGFQFEGLPSGTYEIQARKGELDGPEEVFLTRQPKEVALGLGKRVTGIDLVLQRSPKVSGRVINKLTGKGIAGLALEEGARLAVTDEAGEFALRVPPGPRVLAVWDVPKAYGAAEDINIFVGQEDIEDLIIELAPGGIVRGKVVLSGGTPVDYPDVSIALPDKSEIRSYASGTFQQAESHEDGSFEISGIPFGVECVVMGTFNEEDGDARITGTNPADYRDPIDGTLNDPQPRWRKLVGPEEYGVVRSEPFTLAPGEVKDGMVLMVQPYGRVSGTIRDEKGEAVTEGCAVWARPGPRKRTKPDGNGSYSQGGLIPGDISVALLKEHPLRHIETRELTIAPGEEIRGVDFVFPNREPEGSIAGVVVDGKGEPVVHEQVAADRYDEQEGTASSGRWGGVDLTDEAGRFRIENLWEGVYTLTAWFHSPPNMCGGELEEVPCPSEDVTLVVEEYGRIQGRVVRAGSGKPIRRFEIGRPSFPAVGRRRITKFSTFDSPKGFFQLEEVPPGSVELQVTAEGIGSASRTLELGSGEEISDLVIELGG